MTICWSARPRTRRQQREAVIAGTGETAARPTWAGAEQSRFEQEALADGPLADAYDAGNRSTAPPVAPAAGAALRFLAASTGARSVVEIGTGCGASGLWLLRGMARDGILTTVDADAAHVDRARSVFTRAGFGVGRARLICGTAQEVLPRLADGGYDMVFVDADPVSYPDFLAEAMRLLRPGGMVVLHGILAGPAGPDGPLRVPDPAEAAVHGTVRAVREQEDLVPLLLPLGEGLLAAIRP
ncbi:putative O-methyltransferase YrrM [Nocardiopsis algeriensis]|uniref:Putative O-methyltransferase YrrM n=1 Tax=Nocardiopsis algeriensis TaxID=1478215 RepID=A0A841IJD6_9ACTN|nr:putative O-methyltransferase YrrM [Nocardiopsis algeriensis]